MATDPRELVTSYIQAVGERRLEALPPLLESDAEFTLGDNTVRGREAFVGAFRRLLPIIDRNDIRHLFVDGDEACVIYDFVTSTPVARCSASSTSGSAMDGSLPARSSSSGSTGLRS